MSSIEQSLDRLRRLNNDNLIQNFIAQASSRYILLNTNESRENFPPYTIRDDQLNILAFYYLEIGCSLAENNDFETARDALERGASLLEHVNGASVSDGPLNRYYNLVASLSYYVGFQYSKSFILINKIEGQTIVADLIARFLRRDFADLKSRVAQLMIDPTYEDQYIATAEDEETGSSKIYEREIGSCLLSFVNFFETGHQSFKEEARDKLRLLKEIAEIKQEPSIWWVIRLLLLICDGFEISSLWQVLPRYFADQRQMLKDYIYSLTFRQPKGIYELFITQRKCLDQVLRSDRGCIVSIPTSSGKTRIAELAILDCLAKHPGKKILYVAPFRSLAFEIEHTLEPVVEHLGKQLSHMYGGGLFSELDNMIFEESDLIIATPEKAKAILRGNQELANEIKLVVLDEGHLLGASERLIANEIFFEELRFYMEKNEGRFLLLSAVLPNESDLSMWLTGSRDSCFKDKWRPSEERIGILEWKGNEVNLNWESSDTERPAFNKGFIQAQTYHDKKGKTVTFPTDKNEAVAATAYKLRTFGTVLIFVGLKQSVLVMAKAYLKALGENPTPYNWKNHWDWESFKMASIECYGENNMWLNYATYGILCHNSELHVDVRNPLERLMRNDKPLVIISTSTLGQGVNLGVSTVIFSTWYQAGKPINARDFWNIAGRAGRAFVDGEGKILVSLDASSKNVKAINKAVWERRTIRKYFDKSQLNMVLSGILILIRTIKDIANNSEISFDLLLQLIVENKLHDREKTKDFDKALDLMDDGLLALHYLHNNSDSAEIDYGWIESFFRNSLASIQINEASSLSQQELKEFFKSRIVGLVKKVGPDKNSWKAVITSGIPVSSDLFLEGIMVQIIDAIFKYNSAETSLSEKIQLLQTFLKLLKDIPELEENKDTFNTVDFDSIVTDWVNGVSLANIAKYKHGIKFVSDLCSFKFPWLVSGIAKKLRTRLLEEEAALVEELSILLEVGLPSLTAVKIYQAGIRSRIYAKELSTHFEDDVYDKGIKQYKRDILSNKQFYIDRVSAECAQWIQLLSETSGTKKTRLKKIPDFTFGKVHEKTRILEFDYINGKPYLHSPDFRYKKEIEMTDIDFSEISGIPGVRFEYSQTAKSWKMTIHNPNFGIIEEA